MLKKIPAIAPSLSAGEIIASFCDRKDDHILSEFNSAMARFLRARFMYPTNSGNAAFLIILETLKGLSDRREVILPAYTAGSLVVAVKKAGLIPLLCDISLRDFNIDKGEILNKSGRHTLAVVGAHMFGIPIEEITGLKKMLPPEVFLLEDCAQAMGSKINNLPVGNFCDIGFFSFNRGKNFPLYSGGCVSIHDQKLAAAIGAKFKELIPVSGKTKVLFLKSLAFSCVRNPFLYGLGYPVISHFKALTPPKDIEISSFTNFQASLGLRLLEKADELFEKRYQNGMFLLQSLANNHDLLLPKIISGSRPVFTLLPILFKDVQQRLKAQQGLWQAGFEVSRLYQRPLHQIFDLGAKKDEFPNACYLAERLLGLPVHPFIKQHDMERMVEVIQNVSLA